MGLVSGLMHASSGKQVPVDDPFFDDFIKLQREMDKIFSNFHQKYFSDDKFFTKMQLSAKADLKENGKNYIISVDLPGFEKANIKIEAKDKVISIRAKNDTQKEKKDEHFYQRERYTGSVYNSFILPKDADIDKMDSEYKNGVLTITIPKRK
jgi:HSP20 family protein